MNPRLQPRGSHRMHGFTIVEFMVAVAIGLVVSLVIGQIFVGSKQSFNSQDDLARVQESVRYASQILTRSLRMAGYRSNVATDPSAVFPVPAGAAITGTDDGTGATADTITVRYQGSGTGAAADGSVVDCIGTSIDFGVTSTSTFAVRASATSASGFSLYCSIDGGTTWNELVPDVQNMQLLYGVDNDGDGSANVYVQITDVADLDKIVSVRAWLLVRSPTETGAVVSNNSFILAGRTFTFNDRFVRRVMFTTIDLRNRTL